jgi:hypothetical protein
MANRTVKLLNQVAASTTVTADSPPIPVGKRILFKHLISGDQGTGDNIASIVLIQWGTVGSFEEIAGTVLSGNTIQINIDEERAGDGAKFIRITRQNNSIVPKRVLAWLAMFDT